MGRPQSAARAEHLFRDEVEGGRLLARIGETRKRDDFVVMTYCLTRNAGAGWKRSFEPLLQAMARHRGLVHYEDERGTVPGPVIDVIPSEMKSGG